MKNELVSLEMAKKLKEAGYPQEGVWWWQETINFIKKGQKDGTVPYIIHSVNKDILLEDELEHRADYYRRNYRTEINHFVAPTIIELLEKLPKQTGNNNWLTIIRFKNKFEIEYGIDMKFEAKKDKSLSNALAKMWIYLRKQRVI